MKNKDVSNIPVAIVGMGCFFAQSNGLKSFWRLLFQGKDAITDVPDTHWSPDDFFDPDPKKPDHVYCRRGGFLTPIDFDPTEFGIPPSVLESTDTSQLLALVAARMALEDAGYLNNPSFDRSRTSVILGATGTQELAIPLGARLGHPHWRRALLASGVSPETTEEVIRRISESYLPWRETSFPGLLGNVIAGRVCNRLDLGGTNCVVDAACASSLSAVHLAIMELENNRSDMVLTGGVDLLNDIFMHMCFSRTGVLSPTQDVRPFSKNADGTLLGEGVGILALKRLTDAERNGDTVYAVIKGMGTSSDGKSQSIYAPRKEGQEKALREAYNRAGVPVATIGLVEAHGTGTRVGDQVEFQALSSVFSEETNVKRYCALGSVKSMIGHAKAAAGAAGIIKTALALHHKVLPPTLKANKPDPNLGIEQSPFYLNSEARPWFSAPEHPRRAGVSAFGFGGSNFHVVLEEYRKEKNKTAWDGTAEILAFSADSMGALSTDIGAFINEFSENPGGEMLAYLGASSRKDFSVHMPHRLLMVLDQNTTDDKGAIRRLESIRSALRDNDLSALETINHVYFGTGEKPGKLAFLFPGQGSQYVNMGRELVCMFPEAFGFIEKADLRFRAAYDGKSLSHCIYPTPSMGLKEKRQQENTLRRTDIAQPALGAISMSMVRVLERFGLQPDAFCGHSFGELTALCAAGWIDEESLLSLSIARGRCMADAGKTNENENGTMIVVLGPLDELAEKLKESNIPVVLANRNSPFQGVLSGAGAAIERVEAECANWGFSTGRLPVSAAFHSDVMARARKPFSDLLSGIVLTPNHRTVYSNVSGSAYPQDLRKIEALLSDQLISPVDFLENLNSLYRDGVRTFVEVGPRAILTGLVKESLTGEDITALSMNGTNGKESAITSLAVMLCRMGAKGYDVSLDGWETLVEKPVKKRMRIPVSGANPLPKPTEVPTQRALATGTDVPKATAVKQVTKEAVADPDSPETPQIKQTESIVTMSSNHIPDAIARALQVTEQGLKSMQALQLQTAEAHQKFLETQAEAAKALQEMIASTRTLMSLDMGQMPATTKNSMFEAPADAEKPEHVSLKAVNQSLAVAPTLESAKQAVSGPNTDHLTQALLSVVSRLTGYSEEMLGMDMDIESDLGIDSIKRVEILSAMEEAIPGLPAVSPDVMGSLKTLGQIVAYLSSTSPDNEPDISGTLPRSKQSTTPTSSESGIKETLLATVSRLTGYPEEMLGMEMDIESDLGIDSIKRVEILSAMEEALPGLPAVSPDVMGSLKTLGSIVEYLSGDTSPPESVHSANGLETLREVLTPQASVAASVDRFLVSPTNAAPKTSLERILPLSGTVFITDDGAGLSFSLVEAFLERGIKSALIPWETAPDIRAEKMSLTDVCGLVLVPNFELLSDDGRNAEDLSMLKEAFLLARHAGPGLLNAAKTGGALFATVTRLDGAFGFTENPIFKPMAGALSGLVKTAALEWENVRCRALDIAPDWNDFRQISDRIVSELIDADLNDAVEIGIDKDIRTTLGLTRFPISGEETAALDLRAEDVVVISGGARGVTAATARALARSFRPTLVLLGRSPEPFEAPEWLKGLNTQKEIKTAIIENEFKGKKATPKTVDELFKKYTANLEITENMAVLRSMGSHVRYASVDIRNLHDVSEILSSVRKEFGPIKGIIHGAGVLEDKLILDKSNEQFERVIETKIAGLQVLLSATKEDPVKFTVLFSSVAARFGNIGQADYAMANEALNKIARYQTINFPERKTIAINWGPWDGGMVSDTLKKEFKRRQIDLIPMERGAESLVDELTARCSSSEIIIGTPLQKEIPAASKNSPVTGSSKSTQNGNGLLRLMLHRDIDLEQFPVLASHRLDGTPVVPFALLTEWIGHSALHDNPGLLLQGVENMRLLKGIRMDVSKKVIRLLAGKAKKRGDTYEVDVEIRNGIRDVKEVLHSNARALLSDRLPTPPDFDYQRIASFPPYGKSIKDVYENILFHGHALQGILKIIGLSANGMAAEVAPAPSPEMWMTHPMRSQWIADPLVLDSAFQMACVWCYEHMGMVSLPSFVASFRQYRRKFPDTPVTAVLDITDVTNRKMTGNITFLDSNRTVAAELLGYEATMDGSLYKAFKPELAKSA